MNKVKIQTVNHRFEADMIKDILKQIDIEAFISDKNGPGKMNIYLGQKQEGIDVYVEEHRYEDAVLLLNAQPEPMEPTGHVALKKFPYWIILGFAVMLFIFIYFAYIY